MKTLAAKIHDRAQRIRTERRLKAISKKYGTYTMIDPAVYITNLRIAQQVVDVPGCVVECGVWRGGMIAGMAEILGANREYLLFDSFEGLPPAKDIDGPAALAWQQNKEGPHYHDNCRAEMEHSRRAMAMSPAVNYKLIPGWFSDTLSDYEPASPIAVLRLDGDWYDSTMTCLNALFPYVAKGGVVIIDDYHTWDGCSRAVHDYLSRNNLSVRISQVREVCIIRANGEARREVEPTGV
jgi:O-methyltransferase